MALTDRIIDLLKAKYGGSGDHVLLVGHTMAGTRLIQRLTASRELKEKYRFTGTYLMNVGLSILEEQPDGSFALKQFSDAPAAPRSSEQMHMNTDGKTRQ